MDLSAFLRIAERVGYGSGRTEAVRTIGLNSAKVLQGICKYL